MEAAWISSCKWLEGNEKLGTTRQYLWEWNGWLPSDQRHSWIERRSASVHDLCGRMAISSGIVLPASTIVRSNGDIQRHCSAGVYHCFIEWRYPSHRVTDFLGFRFDAWCHVHTLYTKHGWSGIPYHVFLSQQIASFLFCFFITFISRVQEAPFATPGILPEHPNRDDLTSQGFSPPRRPFPSLCGTLLTDNFCCGKFQRPLFPLWRFDNWRN